MTAHTPTPTATPTGTPVAPLAAPGLPEAAIRARARRGTAEVFPAPAAYGTRLLGPSTAAEQAAVAGDALDRARIVPPVFMPERLEKLIDLAREPEFSDVELGTRVGGFTARLPLYLSAFGSTRAGSGDLAVHASRQAARLGIPMVIGENMVPVHGYRRAGEALRSALRARVEAYLDAVPDGAGGIVVQQSTEDADSEVWNLLYSDPAFRPLLESGRLAFELKTGQGAKPGLGGMTVVDRAEGERLAGRFTVREVFGPDDGHRLRCATPGTFTDEILRQQLRFMRNNFPKARTWVKFHPGRDIDRAARTAWAAGADAVTVDGAEGGTGWAPGVFLDHVGLPLAECLRRIGRPDGCLLASGGVWEGGRAVRALALGARAVGLGRAALLAVDEDPDHGLERLADALALELRLLVSALGKYTVGALAPEDLWWPDGHPGPAPQPAPQPAPEPGAAHGPGAAQGSGPGAAGAAGTGHRPAGGTP